MVHIPAPLNRDAALETVSQIAEATLISVVRGFGFVGMQLSVKKHISISLGRDRRESSRSIATPGGHGSRRWRDLDRVIVSREEARYKYSSSHLRRSLVLSSTTIQYNTQSSRINKSPYNHTAHSP
jgi:hypothetical protein